MSKEARAPAWRVAPAEGGAALAVWGDWIAQSGLVPVFPADGLGGVSAHGTLALGMSGVGRWDSGLIAFLWDARRAAEAGGIAVDDGALPQAARKLLGLLDDRLPADAPAPAPHGGPLVWTGAGTLAWLADLGAACLLLSAAVTAGVRAPFGRARVRGVDLLADLRDAGPSALMIVSVVNFLLGAILAFVGAAQLRKFAAGAYVANLVGIALVRELGAVMTAIVMAGRTGGAYAARIATMQGGQEIDALTVTGIPVVDYIVLPSMLSLVITMPLLYLYGCLVGMLGGLVVATLMLNISVVGYVDQTLRAVPLDQFTFGLVKSVAFALLIGVSACHIGLKAGRSAADVGTAATRAVVVGIVGVIALDAVFAVLANAVGL
jgi:phospholipid/cholesterol/gamma-HCH transport system permease protein